MFNTNMFKTAIKTLMTRVAKTCLKRKDQTLRLPFKVWMICRRNIKSFQRVIIQAQLIQLQNKPKKKQKNPNTYQLSKLFQK